MTRRVGLMALAAVLLVVGGWYMLGLRPEQKHIQALNADNATAVSQVATLEAQFSALKAGTKMVPSEEKSLKRLAQLVPAGPSLDQLIETVNDAAKRARMSLTSISVGAPSDWGQTAAAAPASGAGPNALDVTVGLRGSDSGALAFVTDVDSEARLFTVSSLTLESAPTGGAKSGTSEDNTYNLDMSAFYVSAASNNSVFPGNAH